MNARFRMQTIAMMMYNLPKFFIAFCFVIFLTLLAGNAFSQATTEDISATFLYSFSSSEPISQGTVLYYEVSLSCTGGLAVDSPANTIINFDFPYIGYSGVSQVFNMEESGLYKIQENYTLTLSSEELGDSFNFQQTNYWIYSNSGPNVAFFQIDDMYVDNYSWTAFPSDTFGIEDVFPHIGRPGQTGYFQIKILRDINAGEAIQLSIEGNAKWHKSSSVSSIGNIGDTLSGLVLIYNLRQLTSQQFNAILGCTELKYVLTQVILDPYLYYLDEVVLNRMSELAKAGKRLVIQLWFGSGMYYNWSYCGYPNIAMQQEVRDYLFGVIDTTIDAIGPWNIYGVHLLEEDGHFGVDIDKPGYWWYNRGWVYSGEEDGDPYNNYTNLIELYGGKSTWSSKVPNINQYNNLFKSETNLDMNKQYMDPLANKVLDRWMARRLWAGAHREFFQHIVKKYPNIKRFIWGNLAYEWNGTAIDALSDLVDGVIANPYTNTLCMHHWFSGIRKLLPKAELLALLEDSTDTSKKDIRTATAYLNGASAIGFFGTIKNKTWETSLDIWKKISVLPVLRNTQPKILIVSYNTDSGYSTSKQMLQFFRLPTAMHTRDASDINLSQYKIIIIHNSTSFRNDLSLLYYNMTGYGPDDKELKNWVKSGGILVITSATFLKDNSFFISEENIAWTENQDISNELQPVTFCCSSDIASKYNIGICYTLLARVRKLSWGSDIIYDELPIGGVAEYGLGRIVILPIFHNDTVLLNEQVPDEYRNQCIKNMTNYIADVVRGVAMIRDSSGLLANEIISQSEPFGLLLNNMENNIEVKTVFDILSQNFSCKIMKSGDCILGD